MTRAADPEFSIVIPVYNEEESLEALFSALWPAVSGMGRSFEIIFVDDGSRDGSLEMLKGFCMERKGASVIELCANFGQHMAIMAGFGYARGAKIITLDADLQNPPSEIPKVAAALDAGHDVVGTYRVGRRDPFFRKAASLCVNKITNGITKLRIRDYGCMLRGYDRRIVDMINESRESTTFIPALAQKFAHDPVEIPVSHCGRAHGTSKYGLFQLVRLNFDLMTSFSLVPLQLVTMAGMFFSVAAALLLACMFVRRILLGVGDWQTFISQTFEAAGFMLAGLTLFSLGIIGEYIGRIYREVSRRPRYSVRGIYGAGADR